VTLGASVIPTIDNLLDAQGSLLAANALLDTTCRFMHLDMLTTFRLLGIPSACPPRCQGQAGGKVILLYDPDPDQPACVA
jgi:hypothetical protein